MPTLRSASLCALLSFSLFSCTSYTKDRMVVQNAPGAPAIVKSLPAEVVDIASFQQKFIEASTQHFSVSSKKVSVLKSKGGLKITVNPAALVRENGTALEGNIKVSIIELINVNDLFRSNAATISDGKLLVSGGSYFIGMDNGGVKIRIREGETIEAEFPVLKKTEMELFYGQRNEANDMNWQKTNISFTRRYESVSFTDQNRWDSRPTAKLEELIEPKIYKSLDETVYYYQTKMTLEKLVDTLNKKDARVYLQTISYWPKTLPTDIMLDTNYLVSLYGPRKQYILKACKEEEKKKEAFDKWQPKSLAGQLQKQYASASVEYYKPTPLSVLGWINCDYFYNPVQQTETALDMPYTFNNSTIEYFILFKSFNSMLNGRTSTANDQKPSLVSLPAGEEVTFIAFTKKNGIIYQAKHDLVIGKTKTLPVNFKEISAAEMTKIFGTNVKI